METIKITNAGKQIKGTWIFHNISISFSRGKIYGLIGRNGSGKTMLLKSIAGLVNLTEGSIYVQGKALGVDIDVPESIGAIIEVPGFLPHLDGYANLRYLASLRNLICDNKINETLQLVGLQDDMHKRVGRYSLGMRQRLGIAQAIMENPDILLLDEPMNGLDYQGVLDVKKILIKLSEEGKTIILASHNTEDIDELCDEVYQMDAGKIQRLT